MRKLGTSLMKGRRDVLLGSLIVPAFACDRFLPGRTRDEPVPEPGPPPEVRDIELLNAGILLEQTAVLAYTAAAGLPFIQEDAQVMAVAKLFMGQHEEHRDTLIKLVGQLGGKAADPADARGPDIPAPVLDAALDAQTRKIATLRFARDLERLAADTYFQLVVAQLQTDLARRNAIEILPVEAQHVALFDLVLGAQPPINAAFFSEQS